MKKILIILFIMGILTACKTKNEKIYESVENANRYYQDKKYDKAEKLYRDAYEMNMENKEILSNLAKTLKLEGKDSDLIQLLENEKEYRKRYEMLAELYKELGDKEESDPNKKIEMYENSKENYKKAIRNYPSKIMKS